MKNWKSACCFVLVALLSATAFPAKAQDDVDFIKQIKPILESHCLKCHVGDDAEGVDLTISNDAMDYIEAEDSDNSDFYLRLISDDEEELMPPPDDENPLTAEQIELVKNWIDQGANWPENVSFVLPEQENPDTNTADPAAPAKPADDTKIDETLFRAIGSLHPAAVHLPIGLLLAAGLFALLGIRGNFVMSDCAYYCLWLGVIGAIVACVSGWWFSPMENRGTVTEVADLWDQTQVVFWHRTTGLICTAFALILALFAASARAKDPDDGVFWKLGLIVLAVGIGFVGHQGGEMTHGKNHYKDLNKLMGQFAPGIFGEPVNEAGNIVDDENDPANKADENSGDEPDVGKSSDESNNVDIQLP